MYIQRHIAGVIRRYETKSLVVEIELNLSSLLVISTSP